MTTLDNYLSVRWLSNAYRGADRLSSVEVTRFFLDRIHRFDDEIQSMVTVTPELALEQARRADERLAAGDPSPLLGVPIVIKDLIDVAGVPTTAGSRILANNVATRSAAVWKRLENAGAALLGKANTHEFAYGGTTEPTVNPWDTGRLVGGSSGGPGAALAAGLAPLALGTDTAGSARIPAGLCGVYGFKPTNKATSNNGVIPLAPSLDVVGLMGHHSADLATLLTVTANPAFLKRHPDADQGFRDRIAERSLRVAVLDNPGNMSPGAETAFEQVCAVASEFGVVSKFHFNNFAESVMANFTVLGVEASIYHQQFKDRSDLYTPYVRDRLHSAGNTLATDFEQARRVGMRYRSVLDRLFRTVDVLVMPGVPFPAPRIGITEVEVGSAVEDRDTSMCRNTGFANLTGHPALAMPVGFEHGLPVGIQLVARRGGDFELLAFGQALSRGLNVSTIAPEYTK